MILRVPSFFSNANLCITAIIIGLACSPAWAQTPITFEYTGEVEIYVVPSCVAQIEVTLEGASGGGGNGGGGRGEDEGCAATFSAAR